MKRTVSLLVLLLGLAMVCTASQHPESSQLPIDAGCTAVYATDGEIALGGNNKDSAKPFTRIWFVPGEDGDYGRVYVGYEDFYKQGGMNDQGLFFDGLAVLKSVDVPKGDKERGGLGLIDRIMRDCATVDCVINYFDTYHLRDTWRHQYMFGDASGNAAIIEPLTAIRMEGNYQVVTNFYQSESMPESYDDRRYQTATEMLETAEEVSVESIRDVMDAVHQAQSSPTLYTTIYDLKQQLVYLHYFHDYDNVRVFDLGEELARGPHGYEMESLFPQNSSAERWKRPIITSYESFVESNIDTSVSTDNYDAYEGTYLLPHDEDEGLFEPETVSVVSDDYKLWLVFLPVGIQFEFLPRSDGSFFHVEFLANLSQPHRVLCDLTFDVDPNGEVTQLNIDYGEVMLNCERQSDEVLPGFVPILPVERPESEAEEVEPGEPAIPGTESGPAEASTDDGLPLNILWIVGLAGGLILLGGAGLFFGLRARRN